VSACAPLPPSERERTWWDCRRFSKSAPCRNDMVGLQARFEECTMQEDSQETRAQPTVGLPPLQRRQNWLKSLVPIFFTLNNTMQVPAALAPPGAFLQSNFYPACSNDSQYNSLPRCNEKQFLMGCAAIATVWQQHSCTILRAVLHLSAHSKHKN